MTCTHGIPPGDFAVRMLQIPVKTLIIVCVVTLKIQFIQAKDRTPTCSIMKSGLALLDQKEFQNTTIRNPNHNCTIEKGPDNCLNSIETMSFDINVSKLTNHMWKDSTEYSYVNVTVDYNWGTQSNRFLLQENVASTCWNIQVFGDDEPSHIILSDIPVSANFKELIAATEYSGRNEHQSCDLTKKSCKALNESSLRFTSNSNAKSVKLEIHIEEDFNYRIELLSAECNITCEGINNNCSVKIQNKSINFNLKTNHLGFYNLTPAFYCARIGSENDCCVIHTETVKLEVPTEFSVVIVRDPMASYAFIALVLVAVLTVFALIYAAKSKLPGILRILKKPKQPPEGESGNSLVPKPDVTFLVQEMKDTIQVYLVYKNDSKEFLNLMSSFRRLLACYVQRVWDPFSDEDMENVSNNISKWVETILTDQKIQLIIVETESAVKKMNMWIEGEEEDENEQRHFLDNTFIYTLSYLMNDVHRFFDYSSTFIVRLDSSFNNNFNLLPCTRYSMPDHFEALIFDLSRQISKNKNINYQDFSRLILCSNQREEFVRAQKLYNLANVTK